MRFSLIIIGFLLAFTPARADVTSDLRAFWDGLGGTGNLTGPSSFKGQAAGYYTLGNVRARSQSRSSQLLSISLPSIRAGCGGIDVFSGGFSHVNADEIVALSKAIASNAVGFAFELALTTISPAIADVMGELRNVANLINAANINSCEAAQGLVASVWPKDSAARDTICQSIGRTSGRFTDAAAARHECGTPSVSKDVIENATSTDEQDRQKPLGNIAWKILRDASFPTSDWLLSDRALAEFLMSLSGTVVVTYDGDDPQYKHYAGRLQDPNLITWLVEGGNIPDMLTCDSVAGELIEQCLSPTTGNINITAANSLSNIVDNLIDEIIKNLRDAGAKTITPRQIGFVNATAVPLYRILNVYSVYGNNDVIDGERDNLVEIVASDIAYQYITGLIDDLIERPVQGGGADNLDKWRQDLLRGRENLRAQINTNSMRYNRVIGLVQRVELIEKQLANSLNSGQNQQAVWQTRGGR